MNRRNEDLKDLQELRHLYFANFGIAPTMSRRSYLLSACADVVAGCIGTPSQLAAGIWDGTTPLVNFLSLLEPVIDPSTGKNVCLGYEEQYLNYKYLEKAAAEAKAKKAADAKAKPTSMFGSFLDASPSRDARLPSAEEHQAFAVILDAVVGPNRERIVETLTHLVLSLREDHIDPTLYAAYTLVQQKGNKKLLAVGKVQVIDALPSRVDKTDENFSRTLKRLTKRSTTNYAVDWKAFEGLIVALHRIGFFCCTGQKKGLCLGKPDKCKKPRDGWKSYELIFTTAQQSRFATILIIEYLKKRWTGPLDETSTAPMPSRAFKNETSSALRKRKNVVPEEATYCQPAPTLLRAASELHHSWPQEFGMGLLHWLPPTKQEPRRASTQDSDSNLEDNFPIQDDIIEFFGSRSPGSSLHTSPPSRLLDSSHFNISPFTFSPFPRVSTFSAVSESGETLTFKQKRLQFVLPSSSKRQRTFSTAQITESVHLWHGGDSSTSSSTSPSFTPELSDRQIALHLQDTENILFERQKLETLRHAPSSSSSSSSSSSCLPTWNEV